MTRSAGNQVSCGEDKSSFEREVIGFAHRLRAFIGARISVPSDAEDIAQDVLLKVFRGRSTLRDRARLNAWIYRTARSAIIDHYRGRRLTEEVSVNLPAETELPDDLAQRLQRTVRRFTVTLPQKYRRPLELAEIEGLTARRVAEELGLTETAAKSRIARARTLLQQKLTQCCRFEFDSFGNVVDFQQRSPCACGDHDPADVEFSPALKKDAVAIRSFLAQSRLSLSDLTSLRSRTFFVARQGGLIVGAVGLETYNQIAVLRSLAVTETQRNKGVGRRLVAEIERVGRQLGVKQVFVLTAAARPFFEHCGYAPVSRRNAPAEVRRIPNFITIAPQSATLLARLL